MSEHERFIQYPDETVGDLPPEPVVAKSTDLIYGLEAKPPLRETLFAAVQHVLASFIGIITPSLIIGGTLGLEPDDQAYLISMSLFVSGIATFIQTRRIGPVGSGLLSIQGTSFAFIGPIIGAGTAAIAGGATPTEAMGLIFGMCLLGSCIEMVFSQFIETISRVITPLVTGTVVMLIGLTLINAGVLAMGGGALARQNQTYGSAQNIFLSFLVLVIIIVLNSSRNTFLRMASIAIGLIVGYIVGLFMGVVDLSGLGQTAVFTLPIPFKYGFGFNPTAFIPFAFLYLITTIESIGDLTATSVVTGQPIQGETYFRRMRGGVLADGLNSFIAALFNTFPNTTFSQNNGVIQLTGIGSRYVGYFIAVILSILGLFPIIGGVLQAIPQPVLGGATIIMFGSVAAAGIKIVASIEIGRREAIILATSLGLGLGVAFAPDLLTGLPPLAKNIFGSGISTGGICALVLNILLPGERR
ncbi:xanthine permease [Leptolyngbya sp. Heron Island J]|uniref:uracil-xanthine permease family protein n=1 Tax=Leptolyngbya sp. Heron Island J TaxID=1385935 RepID=UPI0003B9954D|nr:nucleobase:cation symporter-2 family protein [Leptolyngbya sp. Heron Island J]ESA34941.1 xanthine permease [Leptolyngbya sp. Heron Island J]